MAASAWQHGMPVIIHFLQLQSWVSRLTTYLSPNTDRCATSNTFPPAQLHYNSYRHIRFYSRNHQNRWGYTWSTLK